MSGIATESIAIRACRLLEPVLERDGYELVEIEWVREAGGWVLRIYVDRPEGVGILDCEAISRVVEPILDVEDFIEPAYNLEVSSPGIDRPLRKPSDFSRFAGKRAHIRTHGPVESARAPAEAGPRKNWTGVLRGWRDGDVEIEVDGNLHRIPHAQIAKAHLEVNLEEISGRKD